VIVGLGCIFTVYFFLYCLWPEEPAEEVRRKTSEAQRRAREAAQDRNINSSTPSRQTGGNLNILSSSSVILETFRISIIAVHPRIHSELSRLAGSFARDPVDFYALSAAAADKIDLTEHPELYAVMKRGKKWTEYMEYSDGDLETWLLKVIGAGETIPWESEESLPLIDILT
jgi:hypothetical protein